MHKFVIEDEVHADSFDEYSSLDEVIVRLQKLSSIPWNKEPNQAPCTNWKNCGRRYEVVEYDTSTEPWSEVRRVPALNISAGAVLWTPVIRKLSSKISPVPKDKISNRFAEVRKVLMEDWDPIGVNEAIEAQDEYDDYVNQVLSMTAQGASVEDIAKHLVMVTTDLIGMPANYDSSRKVAVKIVDALKR